MEMVPCRSAESPRKPARRCVRARGERSVCPGLCLCERARARLSRLFPFRPQSFRTHPILKILQGPAQPIVTVVTRLPAEQLAGARDVGLAELRVVLGQRLVDDRALAS